jgi:hypothetical protein
MHLCTLDCLPSCLVQNAIAIKEFCTLHTGSSSWNNWHQVLQVNSSRLGTGSTYVSSDIIIIMLPIKP